MSNQPAPTRPWFRLGSISRPAPQAPSQSPEPAPAPPRPAAVRPTFRPVVQAQPPPNQPQATADAPPPVGGVSSVPSSPVAVGRTSQPSSPSDKKPTTTTTVPVSATTSSVPSSPMKTVPTLTAAAAGQTTSPLKAATTASVTSSPAKPVTTTTSVPTSPAKTAPTTTPVTSSPTQKPDSVVTTTTHVPSPKASTTTVKPAIQSPSQSPKIKPPTAPAPSPLTLPPPQLKAQAELEPKIPVEAEQKTVLVQKTFDKLKERLFSGAPQKDLGDTHKPSIPLDGQKEPSKDGEKKEKGHGKKFSSDSEDAGTRVITIAGENKGAFMEVIRSPHKNGFQGSPHHLQKRVISSRTGGDGSDPQSYRSSSEEGDRKMKDKSNKSKTMPITAFLNSNVQGINNSIVYNSSCTHHDPGVHLSLHVK
ncbi:proteoglycan 4 [Durio zibethinus]|uniref:Proteoglycan 4 n=1 Tax=Durio zibethinus TaxID=66656 RepID=A0A6P6AXZ9_DURZI|nr:proteoglycan 4 [Durio zibethinus]